MSDLSAKSKSDDVITPKIASKILKVHVRTLKRWAKSGKLREFRMPSGHSRYYRSDILNIATQNVVNETKKEKLSLPAIFLLLFMWIKGLFR